MPSSGRIPAPAVLVPVVQAPGEVAPQVRVPPAEALAGTVLAVPGRGTPAPAALPTSVTRAARVIVADRATGLPAGGGQSGRTLPARAGREA